MSSETRPKVLLSGMSLRCPSFRVMCADGGVGPLQYAKDELREQVGAIADIVVSIFVTFVRLLCWEVRGMAREEGIE
jgi:hypothetical protein